MRLIVLIERPNGLFDRVLAQCIIDLEMRYKIGPGKAVERDREATSFWKTPLHPLGSISVAHLMMKPPEVCDCCLLPGFRRQRQ